MLPRTLGVGRVARTHRAGASFDRRSGSLASSVSNELPQRRSLPLLGDTLSFITDPDGFLLERARELGPVFKIRFLGDDVACFVGPEAFHGFLDQENFERGGASPPSVEEILHPTAVPFLDGEAHAVRKQLLMRVFDDDALASYSRIAERVVTRYARRWAELRAFSWVPEITSMGMTAATALFIGADPDKDQPAIERAFLSAFNGMLSVPIALPFTQYGHALKDRDFLRERIAEAFDEHKESPKDDTLGRLIAARTKDGQRLTDDQVRIEMFHFFGAYVVVVGALTFEAMFLGLDRDVKEKLRAEIREKLATGPITYARLRELPYLERVSKEARRARTVAPVTVFARAKRDCEVKGVKIPKGMKAVGCIGATLQDARVYPEPKKFDPDRWLRAGEKQEAAWVPHGGGVHLTGHRCAGERLAEMMLKMFVVVVLRDYDFTFASGQSFESTTGTLFATPRGGLDVRFRRLRPDEK